MFLFNKNPILIYDLFPKSHDAITIGSEGIFYIQIIINVLDESETWIKIFYFQIYIFSIDVKIFPLNRFQRIFAKNANIHRVIACIKTLSNNKFKLILSSFECRMSIITIKVFQQKQAIIITNSMAKCATFQ